jgi:hypothetical protein
MDCIWEPNMDLCSMMMNIYQEKELSSYVINSSKNYRRDFTENPYSQMVLHDIRTIVCKR